MIQITIGILIKLGLEATRSIDRTVIQPPFSFKNVCLSLYLYKYEIVCLSVCLFVTAFLGHFQTDWDTHWHKVAFRAPMSYFSQSYRPFSIFL